MDITGMPAAYWLICILYIINLMQLISQPSLGGISAMQKVAGYVQDTSKCLHYHWWQQVYYLNHDTPYPSQSREKLGCWCGWADDHGDILTYWVLTDDTKQLIPVSDICPAHLGPNQRAFTNSSSSPLLGEPANISSESMGQNWPPPLILLKISTQTTSL